MKYEPIFDTIMKSSVFRTDGKSIELCEAIIELCKGVKFEQDVNWEYGEGGEACLSDFIIGAYWALSEWHAGQSHITYAALSALGSIFSPGMSGPPDEECSEWTAYEQVGKHFERGGT